MKNKWVKQVEAMRGKNYQFFPVPFTGQVMLVEMKKKSKKTQKWMEEIKLPADYVFPKDK